VANPLSACGEREEAVGVGLCLEISNDISGSGIRTSSYTEGDEKSARIDHVD
jgi:hypothetical protein